VKGELSFPAPGQAPRTQLVHGRWQSVMIDQLSVATGLMMIPISGRRVITSPAVGYVPYNLLNSADVSVIGAYSIDPDARVILWFDEPGIEARVTPAAPQTYLRLMDGVGVYVPMGSPAEFLVPFHRLFIQVAAYAVGFDLPSLILDIESATEVEGDRG